MSSVRSDAKPLNPATTSSNSNIPGDKTPVEQPKWVKQSYEIGAGNIEPTTLLGASDQFSERVELLQDHFEYERPEQEPGLVLIFNQEKFEKQSIRTGSRRDVNEIIICLTRLGYNINKDYIFSDLTKDQIDEEVDQIVAKELSTAQSKYNCLMIFFLTHGESYNRLHAFDEVIFAHDIWDKFVKCRGLTNKPKLFFIQACKGESHAKIPDHQSENFDLVPSQAFQPGFFGPDMLVVYSTTEGNVSFRDVRTGSWFIQELCKNFAAYGRREDILSLVMRTTKCIGKSYYHKDKTLKKQLPIFISSLRKKFYLTRTKDRSLILLMLKNQAALEQKVSELEKKMDAIVTDKIKHK